MTAGADSLPTLLVVDDIDEIVDELLTLLELNGMSGIGASNLREAVIALEETPSIRVIACDIRLDRESGVDLITLVRSRPLLRDRDFAYLFVTGEPTRLDLLPGMPEHLVLTKPIQPRELVTTLRRLHEPAG